MNEPGVKQMSKVGSELLFLCDWETTGLIDREKGHVEAGQVAGIELAVLCVIWDDFTPLGEYETRVKLRPGHYAWAKEAEKIHGITEFDAISGGIAPAVALTDLELFITQCYSFAGQDLPRRLWFGGWNFANFDLFFLEQLQKRADRNLTIPISHRTFEVGTVSKFINLGSISDEAWMNLKKEQRGNHSALADVHFYREVLIHGKKILED